MKTRLNTTIDRHLLEEVKIFAGKKQVSVSQLIEGYFKTILRKKQTKNKTVIDFIKSLPAPDTTIVEQSRDKTQFYEEQYKKYGF